MKIDVHNFVARAHTHRDWCLYCCNPRSWRGELEALWILSSRRLKFRHKDNIYRSNNKIKCMKCEVNCTCTQIQNDACTAALLLLATLLRDVSFYVHIIAVCYKIFLDFCSCYFMK